MLTTADIDAYIQDPALIARTWQSNDPSSSEDPSGELKVVEARIEVVSSILASLFTQSHQLKGRINDLHCPLIRLLPPEIIAEIFRCCLPDFLPFCMDDFTGDLKKYAVPLILGAVCGAWRRVAWSTPSLWSALTLRVTNPNSVPGQVILLDEWLKRSGQLPLNIRLCSTEDVSWGGTTPEGFMVALNKHSDRWKLLDIRFPSLCYKFFPVDEEGKSFPMLSSVLLKPPGGQGDRIHRVNLPSTPHLQHVNLSCLYLRSLNFQWDALRSLELDSFYNDECVEMLRQTTNLVTFTIRKLLGGDDRHEMPDNPIPIPSLEEMFIYNDKDTDITQLVTNISTPKLRLLFYKGEGNTRCPRQELIAFLRRSECQLKELHLSDCTLSEVGLEQLLRAVPTLTTLSLSFPFHASAPQPVTDSLIRLCDPVFANALKQECLLPELRTLTYSGPPSFSYPAMARMLQMRTFTLQTQQTHIDTLLQQVEAEKKARAEEEARLAAEAERLEAEAAAREAQALEESALFGIDVSIFQDLDESTEPADDNWVDGDLLNIDVSVFDDDIVEPSASPETLDLSVVVYQPPQPVEVQVTGAVEAESVPAEVEDDAEVSATPDSDVVQPADDDTDGDTTNLLQHLPFATSTDADSDVNDDDTQPQPEDPDQAQPNLDPLVAPTQTIVNITTHTQTDNTPQDNTTTADPAQAPTGGEGGGGGADDDDDDDSWTEVQPEDPSAPAPTDLSQTPPPTFPNPPPPILTILNSLTELEGSTTPSPPRPKLAAVSVLNDVTLTLKCQFVPPPDPLFPALLQSTEEETGIVLFRVVSQMIVTVEEES